MELRRSGEKQDELRHHPCAFGATKKRKAEKRVASGEHPGFSVRCLFGLGSMVVLARSGCSPQKCVDGF